MHPLLILIIAFVLLEFGVSSVLSWLNGKWMTHPIPAVLEGLYDEEKYQKQQAYMRANARVGWIERCVSLAITLAVLIPGVLGWLDTLTTQWTHSLLLQLLIFFSIYAVVSAIISLPFSYYDTFVIEQKFGFNKTTKKTFWFDALKSFLLTLVLGSVLLAVIFILYSYLGKSFWIWATIVCAAFIIFFSLFYSNLIVPLFNKQKPLEQGALRTAIEDAAHKMGFSIKNIYVINGSKHSTKANAYFTGFGMKKRVVLYDTLIQQLTTDEIVGVLAHEIGHYKHRHQLKGLLSNAMTSLLMLFLFSLVIDSKAIANAAGCSEPSFYINLLVFSMFYSPVELVLSMVNNVVSRRHEWQADEFAKVNGKGMAVSSGLRKMSANSLSNLTPHPLVVFMEYSHPTLLQRVRHLE